MQELFFIFIQDGMKQRGDEQFYRPTKSQKSPLHPVRKRYLGCLADRGG